MVYLSRRTEATLEAAACLLIAAAAVPALVAAAQLAPSVWIPPVAGVAVVSALGFILFPAVFAGAPRTLWTFAGPLMIAAAAAAGMAFGSGILTLADFTGLGVVWLVATALADRSWRIARRRRRPAESARAASRP